MRIPFFGKIIIYHEITLFTKTFASLLKNSVYITSSMEILTNITNNEVYKDIMIETISNIASGEKISLSFENKWCIPDVAYYMIVTGESTGELSLMMEKVANYYSDLHKSKVTNLKSFLEPIMIVILPGLPRDRPGRAPRKVFIIFLSIVNYSLPAIMNCELFFLSLASPKILRLGNTQINLALPSAFRIFGCVLDTHVRQNASKLAFALTYSYLCALLGIGENNYNK